MLTLDDLFAQQSEINDKVQETLSDRMDQFGFRIRSTQITNVNPADSVKTAMNEINASARLKVAAVEKAEAEYISTTRRRYRATENSYIKGLSTIDVGNGKRFTNGS